MHNLQDTSAHALEPPPTYHITRTHGHLNPSRGGGGQPPPTPEARNRSVGKLPGADTPNTINLSYGKFRGGHAPAQRRTSKFM